MRTRLAASLVVTAWLLCLVTGRASQPAVTASGAWIAVPAAGATTAPGYVEIQNPTMYDVYVVAVTSDAAGAIELREGGTDGETVDLTFKIDGGVPLKVTAAVR